jgi:hypothetical protein
MCWISAIFRQFSLFKIKSTGELCDVVQKSFKKLGDDRLEDAFMTYIKVLESTIKNNGSNQ